MSRLHRKRGRKSNYAHSLNNQYWHKVRKKILFRDRCCVICQSKLYLEVHHLTYYINGKSILGKELEHLDKLILLCSKHHKIVHKDKSHKLNPKNFNK